MSTFLLSVRTLWLRGYRSNLVVEVCRTFSQNETHAASSHGGVFNDLLLKFSANAQVIPRKDLPRIYTMCLPVKNRDGGIGAAADTGEGELSLSSGLQDLEVNPILLVVLVDLSQGLCVCSTGARFQLKLRFSVLRPFTEAYVEHPFCVTGTIIAQEVFVLRVCFRLAQLFVYRCGFFFRHSMSREEVGHAASRNTTIQDNLDTYDPPYPSRDHAAQREFRQRGTT